MAQKFSRKQMQEATVCTYGEGKTRHAGKGTSNATPGVEHLSQRSDTIFLSIEFATPSAPLSNRMAHLFVFEDHEAVFYNDFSTQQSTHASCFPHLVWFRCLKE